MQKILNVIKYNNVLKTKHTQNRCIYRNKANRNHVSASCFNFTFICIDYYTKLILCDMVAISSIRIYTASHFKGEINIYLITFYSRSNFITLNYVFPSDLKDDHIHLFMCWCSEIKHITFWLKGKGWILYPLSYRVSVWNEKYRNQSETIFFIY